MAVLKIDAQQRELSLRRYSVSDGLSDNAIHAIYFDSRGFAWIGTSEGLNRFDGEEFIAYKRSFDQKPSVSGNVVTDILEDKNGWLWITMRDGGITQFNPVSGEFRNPKLPLKDGDGFQQYAHSVELMPDGSVVIATDKGVYISDNGETFTQIDPEKSTSFYDLVNWNNRLIAACNVYSITEIKKGAIDVIRKDSNTSFPYPAFSLNCLHVDSQRRLWLGAWDNCLHRFGEDGKVETHHLLGETKIEYAGDEVRAISETRPGILWLGMKSGNIIEYNTSNGESQLINFSKRESSKLFGTKIYALLTDKYGRTWIGTDNGLHVYDPSSFRFEIESVGEGEIITSFTKHNNELVVASTRGIYRYSAHELTPTGILINGESPEIWSMVNSRENELYVGTQRAIYRLDEKANALKSFLPVKKTPFHPDKIQSSRYNIGASIDLNGGEVMLFNAFGHGIITIDTQTNQWVLGIAKNDDGIENLIRAICVDSQNRIWLGGSLCGVSRVDLIQSEHSNSFGQIGELLNENNSDVVFRNIPFNDGLESKDVSAISERPDGRFWVSTNGGGLYEFNPESKSGMFSRIDSPFQTIGNVISDLNGEPWMVAAGGLLHRESNPLRWTRYDSRHGIPEEGLTGALFQDDDGRIYAGGNGFMVSINPDAEIGINEIPRTTITHFNVMDQEADSLLNTENFSLEANDNFITIHFASLCFTDASSVTFQYKLEGLDEDWRNNGTVNSVSYNDLAPGDYLFRVRSKTASGYLEEKDASIRFSIRYPFYMSWWFIVLAILILSLLVWSFIRYRKIQRIKLEKVRNKIARDLHDDIGSALGSISFFSETAKKTLADKNEDTARVLEKIGSTSRVMIENMHDIVWAVDPDKDTFAHIIERMKSFVTDLVSSNNLLLNFHSSPQLNQVKLTMTERKNLFLIFKEAMYNSAKYADCKKVNVSLNRFNGKRLMMILSDDGKGFNVEERMGKGNGLRNMKSRAEEIGASFRIISLPGKGTTIEVMLE